MTRATAPPDTAIVGAGRLAGAFLPVLLDAGWPVRAVAARSAAAARRLRRRHRGIRVTSLAERATRGCGLVLLAVPDGRIRPVAEQLAESGDRDWTGVVVLHHAGALGPDALAPLAGLGAEVGVMHPLQALGTSGAEILPGSSARVEGTRRAVALARRLARAVGLRILRLRRPMRPEDRAGYHAAASLVSNDVVAIWSLALELMEESGVERRDAAAGLTSLAAGTLRGLRDRNDARGALTGPVARGDVEVLARQLRGLARQGRDAREIHRLLSRRLARVARAAGTLDEASYRAVLRVLDC